MFKRKKVILIPFLVLIGLASCDSGTGGNTGSSTLKIISMNDFHGVVEKSSEYPGMEAFGAKIKELYKQDPNNTIILSAGDMFQGSGVSSVSNGKVVIDCLNEIGLNAMTIGNHEFDWGTEVLDMAHDGITTDFNYATNTEANPEANFSYIACNILNKSDNSKVSFADDYVVITKGKMKIGVIGYIGTEQLDSIVSTIGENYIFADPITYVAKAAKTLRTVEKCDVVIASGHDASDSNNNALTSLTGDERIDMVLNAHTHDYYTTTVNSKYVIQSGSYGLDIGYSKIKVENGALTNLSSENIYKSNFNSYTDSTLKGIIDKHIEAASPIIDREIGTCNTTMDYDNYYKLVSKWTSDSIRQQSSSDFGFTNYGGMRASGFPILAGKMTYGTVLGIMPFDNCIVTCNMTGSEVSTVKRNSAMSCSLNSSTSVTSSKTYKVAFDEYSYGKYILNHSLYSPTNVTYTLNLVRDAMVHEIEYNTTQGLSWDYTRTCSFPIA